MATGFFKELGTITNKVLELLYTDQNLMRYLAYDTTTPIDNTPGQPDVDGSKLVFKRLFPFPMNPDAVTKEQSIITVYIKNSTLQKGNRGFRSDILCIDVMVNLDSWRLDDDERIRPYAMMSLIDSKFNNQLIEELSINSILFEGVTHMAFSEKYHGYRMYYKLSNNSNVEC